MKRLLFVLGLAAFCACGGNNSTGSGNANLKNGKVVVVFEDAPYQLFSIRTNLRSGNLNHTVISYLDQDGALVEFTPREKGRDTIMVPTYQGYAELLQKYQGREYDSFLLQEGDTVLVRYDEAYRPFLTSLVYKNNTELYNLPYTIPGAIQWADYHIETVLEYSFIKRIFKHYQEKAMGKWRGKTDPFDERKDMYVNLDSLAVVYDQYQATLRSTMDSLRREKILAPAYDAYLSHRFFPKDRYTAEEVVRSDSLLHYISNYDIAQTYCNGRDVFAKTSRSFAKMERDTVATPLARKVILKRLLDNMIYDRDCDEKFSNEQIAQYCRKYMDITGDSTYVRPILEKIGAVASLGYALPLETADGRMLSLEEVLAQYKGKVVYVDFWASWCAPCRREFPHSREVHKRFSGNDVEFVFFSTDREREAWLGAVEEEGSLLAGSYRVLDDASAFLKEIRLTSIPRYLIFDRNGKLVNQSAPRPSDKSIDAALKRWL